MLLKNFVTNCYARLKYNLLMPQKRQFLYSKGADGGFFE